MSNVNTTAKSTKGTTVASNDAATLTKVVKQSAKGATKKVAKKADRTTKPSNDGKVKQSDKGKVKGSKEKAKATETPEKVDGRQNAAKPTNTVEESYEEKVKGVPVSVTPVQGRGGNRITVWGYPITSVLRYFGRNQLGIDKARTFLKSIGLEKVIGNATVGCQYYGHNIHGGGKVAELSKDEIKKLKALSEG
jgi:hypothetical protein